MASYSLFSDSPWSTFLQEPQMMKTSPHPRRSTSVSQSSKWRNWRSYSSPSYKSPGMSPFQRSLYKMTSKSPKIEKRIQIDPFIKDSVTCHKCQNPGLLYCRSCLTYFCNDCWHSWHVSINQMHEAAVCRDNSRPYSSPLYKSPGMSPFQRSLYKMTNQVQDSRKNDLQDHSWIKKLLDSPDVNYPTYGAKFPPRSPALRAPFSRTPGKRVQPPLHLSNDHNPPQASSKGNSLSQKEFHELLQNSNLHPYSQVFEPAPSYSREKNINGLNDSFEKLQKPTQARSFQTQKIPNFLNETTDIVPSLKQWSGVLPPKDIYNTKYSKKVFLGGVPWDITDLDLQKTFSMFGHLTVEWPPARNSDKPPKGYVYIVFDDENSVNSLLEHCRSYNSIPFRDISSDGSPYKYYIQSKRMPSKEIQIIPWNTNDISKVIGQKEKVNLKYQVFVGGLHGMLTATGLAQVMNDLFKNVNYVEIDTDRYKYPLGSGHVVFCNEESYLKAIHCKYVKISCKSPKIEKRIQIDPFIKDNVTCHKCQNPGPLYCRSCFAYFCNECWHLWHVSIDQMHEYVSRDRNGV